MCLFFSLARARRPGEYGGHGTLRVIAIARTTASVAQRARAPGLTLLVHRFAPSLAHASGDRHLNNGPRSLQATGEERSQERSEPAQAPRCAHSADLSRARGPPYDILVRTRQRATISTRCGRADPDGRTGQDRTGRERWPRVPIPYLLAIRRSMQVPPRWVVCIIMAFYNHVDLPPSAL